MNESTGTSISEECITTLSHLIMEGDHEAVKHHITEKQITPEVIYGYFPSNYVCGRLCPVGLAATCGHVLVMKTLIEAGFSAKVGTSYSPNVHPIHLACEGGSVDVVRTLVEEYGVDITHRDNCYSRPAMCLAAEKGNLEIVQYFIEKGIQVNRRFSVHGDSALHAAAEFNQVDVCKYLLSVGADVNIGNTYNITPLIFSARRSSYASAKVLLDAGADVNFTDNRDETAFMNAAEQGDLDMMKLLQSYGANLELDELFYSSPLQKAVLENRRDIVYYLVNELNVTIESTDHYEEVETLCKLALREGRYAMVRHLFNTGYNPSVELVEYMDNCSTKSSDSSVELAEYVDSDNDVDNSTENFEDSNSALPLRGDRVELRELRQLISRPRSLVSLCVLNVRRLLGRRLHVYLGRLPLPEILKNVIVSCGEKKP